MTYTSVAAAALNYAKQNPIQTINHIAAGIGATKNLYNSFYGDSAPSAPAPTRTIAPRYYSKRPAPIRVYTAYRSYRKKRTYPRRNKMRRVYNKTKKLNKLVGKTPKRSIYTRKTKTMRRFNTAKLSLQSRLQNGGALPNTTFARLFWRGSCNMLLATNHKTNVTPIPANVVSVEQRTLCLNDLSSSPSYAFHLQHPVTYSAMWQTLYKRYQVLGSKVKLKINPSFYPNYMSGNSRDKVVTPAGYAGLDTGIPNNAQPGYWYIRAHYHRSSDGSNFDPVGHPITKKPSVSDPMTEEHWDNLRDFLSDPTVTFKKDMTNIRTKLHLTGTQNLLNNTAMEAVNNTSSTTYEIETTTKPIYLSCGFSAKKHFQDKNPLRNQPFLAWNENLAEDYRFQVRFGYIGFDSSGKIAYHIPIDRNLSRFVEIEINYFVALREPRITPHQEISPLALRAAMTLDEHAEIMEVDNDDELLDDEPYEEPPTEMMELLNL